MFSKRFCNELKELEEKLLTKKSFIILPHYNPDGDAIGSGLAFYLILKKLNKKVKVISPSEFPSFLDWLPEADKIKVIWNKSQIRQNIFSDAEVLIAVDFNEIKRLGDLSSEFEKSGAFKILIDHHPNPKQFTDVMISAPEYSSTAELVYDVLKYTSLHRFIDVDIATCIYAGIMTDTGSFTYNSSTPNTFRVVADLLEYGVDKDVAYDKTYNSFSVDRMRFMGHVMLNRMVVLPEYKSAYIHISAKDRKDFKEKFGDTENFVNIPLAIKGIRFTAIFIERDNFIKISFRSKGNFDVNKFAANHFNGGGHKNAAGGESFSSLQESVELFVKLLEHYKNELLYD